jgi:hypothetical protein
MTPEQAPVVEYGHRLHPLLHLVAPVVTIGAVWAARAVINRTYEMVAGRPPPMPSDPQTSWRRALVWTAVTTTAAAMIEVSVHRVANEREIVRKFRGSAGD